MYGIMIHCIADHCLKFTLSPLNHIRKLIEIGKKSLFTEGLIFNLHSSNTASLKDFS